MSTAIGHAVANENGTATGGKPGNQNGKELRFQNYYNHAKGWNLIRPKDQIIALKLAISMTYAVNNENIGYCQSTRSGLQNALAAIGYKAIAAVSAPCNTDCSALVRACCWVAGVKVGAFNTSNELKVLLATGEFVQITSWNEKDLRAGDILVTKTKGHTAMVVSTTNAPTPTPPKADPEAFKFLRLLKSGCKGVDVMELKCLLIKKGCTGITASNQNFASQTKAAVMAFQKANNLTVDGVAGKNTITALGGVWGG